MGFVIECGRDDGRDCGGVNGALVWFGTGLIRMAAAVAGADAGAGFALREPWWGALVAWVRDGLSGTRFSAVPCFMLHAATLCGS